MQTPKPFHTRRSVLRILLLGLLPVVCCLPASAQSTAFTYQGRLDSGGTPYTGSAEFQPTLWTAASGGSQIAANSPAQIVVGVTNGLFVLPLDFGANFPGAARWLQLEIRTNAGAFNPLTPRQPLTATPYAITASQLTGNLPAAQLSGALPSANLAGTYSEVVNLSNAANSFSGNGAGLTNLPAWRLGGNSGTTPGAQFIGTTDNQALELKVNGIRALRVAPTPDSPSMIGGHPNNVVSNGFTGAVIAGGGTTASPNRIGASQAAILGGLGNSATGYAATVTGYGNTAGGFASTAMGLTTIASGNQATALGWGSRATGPSATAMGEVATASGARSTAMGYSTLASGGSAAAIGDSTIASGFASIALGADSAATNTYSFAAGYRAKANHLGAFVWADSTDADFASTITNQFRVRAGGGLEVVGGTNIVEAFKYSGSRSGGFASPVGYAENNNTSGSSAPALRLVGKGGNSADGVLSVSTLGTGDLARFGNASTFVAWLTTNGTWNALAFNPTSDRAAKENFKSVDAREVLEKVASLPLARWNYKAVPGAEHIGPVAQDFHAAFGLNGGDDKHIATVDADGVALAAIQGLNAKVESGKQKAEMELAELRQQLKRRDAENVELRQELQELKQLVRALTRQPEGDAQ